MNPSLKQYIEEITPSLEAFREADRKRREAYKAYETAVATAADRMRRDDPDNYLANLLKAANHVLVTGS